MADFYANWLERSEDIEKAIDEAPRVAHHKELKWERTRQDAQAALMIAPETGFLTGGSMLMKAEIPVGWHTGEHSHGEEAIYIEQGEGFLILDEERYDFGAGTIFHIPFRSPHQLFNTGRKPVVYLSAMAWHLESFLHMGRMDQLQDCGGNDQAQMEDFPPERAQYWAEDGRRISMHKDQYVKRTATGHGEVYSLGGRGGEGTGMDANGFKMTAVGITAVFVEKPHFKSHSHRHPEAYLYCLEGKGYSMIDGGRHDWEMGEAVHIPPGMKHHQHFNPTDGETKELRFEFGIRYWVVDQWKGWQTVVGDEEASKLDEHGAHGKGEGHRGHSTS